MTYPHATLSDRDALRALAALAQRFALYDERDLIARGIDDVAETLAADEGWTGPDIGERYLSGGDSKRPVAEFGARREAHTGLINFGEDTPTASGLRVVGGMA